MTNVRSASDAGSDGIVWIGIGAMTNLVMRWMMHVAGARGDTAMTLDTANLRPLRPLRTHTCTPRVEREMWMTRDVFPPMMILTVNGAAPSSREPVAPQERSH